MLQKTDKEVYDLIQKEEERQRDGLEMIPSENYTSAEVRECLGSILTNKYSEGYPKKRYYGGNEFIDEIEILAQNRAKKLFDVPHANVQPYSGSPANFAVYVAVCEPGDSVMGLNLPDGGHLTHGWKASATAKFFDSHPYHVKPDGHVDIDEAWKIAKEYKPKLIWAGATAYMYQYEFEKFAEIADSVGAYFATDIAHVAGLVAAGSHPSPVPYAHIVTTTTHKTLRGPRGGMIMVTEKGLAKDPDLGKKIDAAIFPGIQGGPHNHQTAAIAVALEQAMTPAFKEYGQQIVTNAKALAEALKKEGLTLVGNGTENHLILINLVPLMGPGGGALAEHALGLINITMNKNTIPAEPASPFFPSGLRLGTPTLTTRGMKEDDMGKVAHWIAAALHEIKDYHMPEEKEARPKYVKEFKEKIEGNANLMKLRQEVIAFAHDFPVEPTL